MTQPRPTAFVIMIGDRPTATSIDLATAQTVALADETRYQSQPTEHRWDQATTWQTGNGRVWNLMARSQRTKRWGKTMRSVVEVRVLPASTTTTTEG